jgi:hypothetical protein
MRMNDSSWRVVPNALDEMSRLVPRDAAVFSYSAFIVGYSETEPLPVSGRR